MVNKRQIFSFLLYMLIPLCFFVFALCFADSEWLLAPSEMTAKDATYILNNKKIDRSVKSFFSENESESDKRTPVDRVGISFDFTMLDEIKKKFDLPLSFVGTESARIARHEVLLSINKQNAYKAIVHVHGHSSARKKRKSYCVNLVAPQRFTSEVVLKKNLLLNLLEDPYGFEFKFAYDLLSELNLFLSYNQFAVVTINGENQGLYLVVERPKDAILRTQTGVVSILRKRVDEVLEPLYISPDNDPFLIINKIDDALSIKDKKKQFKLLQSLVDMKSYMRWLAVNSLLQNSDSRDELFLYEVKKNNKNQLNYMAWDYGDLQEDELLTDNVIYENLFWAPRQKLDRVIVENPFLYDEYKHLLKNMLTEHFTENKLHKVLDNIKKQLSLISIGSVSKSYNSIIKQRSHAMNKFEEKMFSRRQYLLDSMAVN